MRQHGVVTRDPFSFTFFDQPWVHHEWLGDIFLSFWVEFLGVESLVVWKWGLIISVHLLFFRVATKLSGGRHFWPALVVLVAALAACPYLDIRPKLYTYLGYGLLLNLFWGEGKSRYWIPPLVALWVNLHGGFIFALMALGLLVLPEFVRTSEKRQPAVLLLLASTLATGINPHGFKTTIFPFRYVIHGKNAYTGLLEWLPPFQQKGLQSAVFPYLMMAFVLVSLVWFLGKHRPRDLRLYAALALALLTLAMALRSRRFIPLFALSSVLVLAPGLSQATSAWKGKFPRVAPLLVFLLGCFCLYPMPKNLSAFGYMVAEDQYPIDVCDFMEANELEGNVFALYNYGGYLHLRGQGRWKVFIDGRADTVYSGEHYLTYQKVHQGKPGAEAVVEDSQADYFLWPTQHKRMPQSLLQTGRWQILYVDSVSILLTRKDLQGKQLVAPSPSPYRLLSLAKKAYVQGQPKVAAQFARESLALQPSMRGFQLLYKSLNAAEDAQGAERAMREWNEHFPHNNWFVKVFGP